jgi:hypothetical protein
MKQKFFLLLVLATLLGPTVASAQLQWRISIKVFTGPGGALPQMPSWNLGGATLFQELSNGVNQANNVLTNSGRGYHWQLTEIITVPGTMTPLPASGDSWFDLAVGPGTQDDLDAKAKRNPAGFQFRNNAINFYYVNGTSGPNGGYCAFPHESQHAIAIAPNSYADVLIHEAGHFFALVHTMNGQYFQNADGTPCVSGAPCACARALGGDDGIADTPRDNQCWNQDNIAQAAFGQNYAALSLRQQAVVNNSWLNVMSYHNPGRLLSDDQLDLMTDISNAERFNVATGRTHFVSRSGRASNQQGTSAFPFVTVLNGINAADNGDIVLIRSGNYNEPRTYTKPVTLRTTRGITNIGIP